MKNQHPPGVFRNSIFLRRGLPNGMHVYRRGAVLADVMRILRNSNGGGRFSCDVPVNAGEVGDVRPARR